MSLVNWIQSAIAFACLIALALAWKHRGGTPDVQIGNQLGAGLAALVLCLDGAVFVIRHLILMWK